LFHDAARASACADRTLADLTSSDVDDPAILGVLKSRPAAEILRAAAELEADAFVDLPTVSAVRFDLGNTARAAPWLDRFSITHLRPLRIRGRVRGHHIFVGVPSPDLEVTSEHVAWQAAHEATVAEVHRRARAARLDVAHDPLEHAALVLLHERAHAIGEGAAHARWIAHFANVPPLDRDTLGPDWRAIVITD
jgi:hypothetical protein